MFFLFSFEGDPLQTSLKLIQNGDDTAREGLILKYRPFILKTVSRAVGKYIEVENNEEYSVGLLAFNEAIDCFDASKSGHFLRFAQSVIERRLIDYHRKTHKDKQVYPFSYFENETDDLTLHLAQDEASVGLGNIEIKDEIERFEQQLSCFGISFEDLVLTSPQHRDSKRLSIKIARTIATHDHLWETLIDRKHIPMGELMKLLEVNQRTVERNRKFIIAVCLILKSNLETLQEYVHHAEQGGRV